MDKLRRLIAICTLSTLCFSTPAMAFADDSAVITDGTDEIAVEQNDAEDIDYEYETDTEEETAVNEEIVVEETQDPEPEESAIAETERVSEESNDAETTAAIEESREAESVQDVLSEDNHETVSEQPALKAASLKAAAVVSPNGNFSGTLTKTHSKVDNTINLTSSGRLTLTVKTNINSSYVRLYKDSTQNSDVDYWGIDSGERTITVDLTAGKYIIRFENTSDTGKFTIHNKFVSANETYADTNDTISAVRGKEAIPFNTRINGQLATNDRQDYYKINLKYAGRLSIRMHSDIKDRIEFYIYDDQEERWYYDDIDSGDETVNIDLMAGNYYLEFHDYWDTGNYNFTASFKSAGETFTYSNNTVNAVRDQTAVKMGQSVNGQLAENDDTDYYKLYVPSKEKYFLNVTSELENVSISLYDGNENRVSDVNDNYGSMDKGSKKYIYELTKGTYYLKFYSYSNTGNYKFSMVSSKATAPKQVKLSGLKKGNKRIIINWKKTSCSGYEIQCARNKAFTKGLKKVTVKKSSTVKRTVKKLKAKKTYYVRVRAYRNVNGTKKYGKWSTVKKIKTR